MNRVKYIMISILFLIYLFSMSSITLANDEYPIPQMYMSWRYLGDWDYLYLRVGEHHRFYDNGSYDPDPGGSIVEWLYGVYDYLDYDYDEYTYSESYFDRDDGFDYAWDAPGCYYVKLYVRDNDDPEHYEHWSHQNPLGWQYPTYWCDYCPVCVVEADLDIDGVSDMDEEDPGGYLVVDGERQLLKLDVKPYDELPFDILHEGYV